jgi:hypothetical protein
MSPMRRFLTPAFAGLWLAASPAQAAPPASGLIDVTRYGVAPGGADCGPALRALLAGLDGSGATLYFPAGDYWAYSAEPLFANSDHVEFRGDGPHLTRLHAPTIAAGMPESQYGRVLDASYRPPAVGLDASCPGKVAYRTGGDTVLSFWNHPFAGGPTVPGGGAYAGWARPWTVQACVGPGRSGPLPDTGNLYCVGPWTDPTVWLGWVPGPTPDTRTLAFLGRGQADDDTPGHVFRRADVTISAANVNRIRVACDGNTVTLYCNGQRGGSVTLPGGLRGDWGQYPCAVGYDGAVPPGGQSVGDWTLYGLQLSAAAIATEPPDDAHRYFAAGDPSTVCYVDGSPPSTSPRVVLTRDGPAGGGAPKWGYLWSTTGPAPGAGRRTTSGTWFRGLTLDGGTPAVAIAECLDVRVRDCVLNSQSCGIASVGYDCNYPVSVVDTTIFAVRDAAVSLRNATGVSIERLGISGCGSLGLRFTACDAAIRGLFVSGWDENGTLAVVASLCGDYGANLSVEHAVIDTEGSVSGMKCVVYAQQQFGQGASVRLYDVTAAAAPGVFVWLRGFGLDKTPGQITASALRSFDPRIRSAVRVDGTGWSGTVDAGLLPPLSAPSAGTSAGSVTVTGARYAAPALPATNPNPETRK